MEPGLYYITSANKFHLARGTVLFGNDEDGYISGRMQQVSHDGKMAFKPISQVILPYKYQDFKSFVRRLGHVTPENPRGLDEVEAEHQAQTEFIEGTREIFDPLVESRIRAADPSYKDSWKPKDNPPPEED